jgi:hypothetical protein
MAFYDITDNTVEVITIVSKAQAQGWRSEHGHPARAVPGPGR